MTERTIVKSSVVCIACHVLLDAEETEYIGRIGTALIYKPALTPDLWKAIPVHPGCETKAEAVLREMSSRERSALVKGRGLPSARSVLKDGALEDIGQGFGYLFIAGAVGLGILAATNGRGVAVAVGALLIGSFVLLRGVGRYIVQVLFFRRPGRV